MKKDSDSLNYEKDSPSKLTGFKSPVVHPVVTLFIGRAITPKINLERLAFE
jgi:hypothetical protein